MLCALWVLLSMLCRSGGNGAKFHQDARGTLQVSLLYGREHGLYLDDNAELKMDVKGLVFKNP